MTGSRFPDTESKIASRWAFRSLQISRPSGKYAGSLSPAPNFTERRREESPIERHRAPVIDLRLRLAQHGLLLGSPFFVTTASPAIAISRPSGTRSEKNRSRSARTEGSAFSCTSKLADVRDTVVAAALLGMVFAQLEWAFAANAHQPWRRPRIGLDVAFFLGNYLLWGSVAIGVLESLSGLLGGWVPPSLQASFATQPWWLQGLEVIALSDLGIYWFHRACHSWEPLWRIHRVHHSAEQFDWVAAHHVHPLDGRSVSWC